VTCKGSSATDIKLVADALTSLESRSSRLSKLMQDQIEAYVQAELESSVVVNVASNLLQCSASSLVIRSAPPCFGQHLR
jgi:hypothetical protein